MRTKLLGIAALVIVGVGLFASWHRAEATQQYGTVSVNCEKRGSGQNCDYSIWLGWSDPAYRIDWSLMADGHGATGSAGGKVGVWVCFSPRGAMWSGPCNHAVTPDLPNAGKRCLGDNYSGAIGDDDGCSFQGSYEPDVNPEHYYMISEVYVNDAHIWGSIAMHGNICHFDANAAGCQVLPPDVSPQCSDSSDNDGDGLIDLDDPGCADGNDNDETNVASAPPPTLSLHVECDRNPCQVNAGEVVWFYLYDSDGNPSDKADGGSWGAYDPNVTMTPRPDIAALEYGVGDKARFRAVSPGYVGINTWAGGLPEPTFLTVLSPPPFVYSLQNSGNVNLTKNQGSNVFGVVRIDRTLQSGSGQNVTLSITSPAAFPAGVSANIVPATCLPGCSSNVNLTVAPNAPVGVIPIEVTGQPNNVKTSFILNIAGEPIDVSCSANPSPALIGETIRWTATVNGGTGPYTYVWSGDVPNNVGNVSFFDTTYNTTGIKHALVTVTDSTGLEAQCSNGNNNGSAPGGGGILYVNFNPKLEEF